MSQTGLSATHRLEFPDQFNPRGPDGQGRNRLGLHAMSPTDRCRLRPKTRQAAIDTARGMARFGVITSYAECVGTTCSGCRINRARDQWRSTWVISEDSKNGGVWLLGSLRSDAFGYYYRTWEALIRSVDIPKLTREMHPHWGVIYRGTTTGGTK